MGEAGFRPAAPGQQEGPLAGARVLDVSALLPGPFCTQILLDLGADVIKVEAPKGDLARRLPGEIFPQVNRAKRSVVLDLKQHLDREVLYSLVRGADVFVEGYRPGVADSLGIGYAILTEMRPELVYCSLSGFGRDGPRSSDAGHDLSFLAAGGALGIKGSIGVEPSRPGLPMADLAGATYAAIAILGALIARSQTGRGAHLDVAITDAVLSFAAVRGRRWLDLGSDDVQHLLPANDTFRCSDGQSIALAAVEDHFWRLTAAVLGSFDAELLSDRFSRLESRISSAEEIQSRLRAAFAAEPCSYWLRRLEAAGVPAHPVLDLPAATQSRQTRHRGVVVETSHGRYVPFPVGVVRSEDPTMLLESPRMGQHSQEIRENGWERCHPLK